MGTERRLIEEEDRRKAKLRREGKLPPPPHVFPRIKRSNSWQARLRLRNSGSKIHLDPNAMPF
jgi:hypothetical protein